MTAVSTFSAFFMMPLWIFTLGSTIFNESDIVIPYYKICIYAFFLVIPLSIGLALQRWAPKVSNFMVKILKVRTYLESMFYTIILIIVYLGTYRSYFHSFLENYFFFNHRKRKLIDHFEISCKEF
jgi:sodium/bile acid cotransporter 3/5